jgi:PAS domain S-box-containing protein
MNPDRALANALPEVIWTCTADGRLEWINDRWYELTGLTEEESLNDKGALKAVHPDDLGELTSQWGRAMETASPVEIEYRIRSRSGDYRWHIGRITPLKDSHGTVTSWIAAAFDTHDRRVAEDALRGSQHKFATFFDLSPQPLSITRVADGLFLDVNQAMVDLLGFSRDEFLGTTGVSLGMVTAAHRANLLRTIGDEGHRNLEQSIRTKNGSMIDVVVACARIDIDGVSCFVNAMTDVSGHRAVEDALRNSEARSRARADELAALMDAVPAVVWIARDKECREIYGNRAAYEALRVPMGANLSKTAVDSTPTRHFSVLVNGTEVPLDQLTLQRAARGEGFNNHEEEVRFDDGEAIHLFGNSITLRNPDGTPRGAIGAFHDITPLKETKEALRQADRRKDQFLAMLSHELRNPLTPILASARVLERRVGAEGEEEVATIVRQVKHLSRLVDDLLDASRVASGTITLTTSRLELSTIVAHAVELSASLFEEREHHLEISVPAKGLAVEGDEVRLIQVLDNLLSNAARYTPLGGKISVKCAREGDAVVIRVRDSGVGIDQTLVPELFETFVQGVRGPDRSQGGLGIGLSLVRRLTELHGGTVMAHSDGPDCGSEFTVRLPAAAPLARVSPQRPVTVASVSECVARSARVLLVDDNRDVVTGLSRLLKAIGLDVRSAMSPPEAIVLAETFRPEIVILDIGLPVMDGYTLARELRCRLSDPPPVLIALSGYTAAQDRARSEEAGFALHLAKPVDLDELVIALGKYAEEIVNA